MKTTLQIELVTHCVFINLKLYWSSKVCSTFDLYTYLFFAFVFVFAFVVVVVVVCVCVVFFFNCHRRTKIWSNLSNTNFFVKSNCFLPFFTRSCLWNHFSWKLTDLFYSLQIFWKLFKMSGLEKYWRINLSKIASHILCSKKWLTCLLVYFK